ncbi:hypothetical protein EIP86_004947 [Pleurotus ostreatoroseus]|nr:hypothetical protein EIP86_004947 [Pleurotus ostreatoroseus]
MSAVHAETHTIKFDNQYVLPRPTLILGGKVVSTGADYTVNGVINGIAYLQTGECNFNGENCSLLEMNLANPTCPGCGSSTDISLIPPHAFNVPVSFSYYNGCDGQGTACNTATCNTAFFQPDDNQVQVQCEDNNVDLLITFCGNGAAPATSAATSAAPKPTTSKAAAPTTSKAAPATSSEAATSVVVKTSAAPSPTVVTSSAVQPTISSVAVLDAASSSSAAAPTSAASSASASAKPSRCAKSKKRSNLEKKSPSAGRLHRRARRHMH